MQRIRFYGALAKFGTSFELDVRCIKEAIDALTYQIPGLKAFIQAGLFTIRISGEGYLDNRFLEKTLLEELKDDSIIHIAPVLKGSKRAGLFQTIAGAVLVVVGIFTSWTGGVYLIAAGVALMAGGVAQMLTKTPSANNAGTEAEKASSTGFSSITNLAAQGRPVPLCIGEFRVGSLVISQGVETFTIDATKDKGSDGNVLRWKKRG